MVRSCRWQRKETKLLKISWTESDGTAVWDSDTLHVLLANDFKLLRGPKGEALHLRGAAQLKKKRRSRTKRKISVPYKEGALEKVQVWTVEPNPEAISVDARKEPRHKASLNRRAQDVDTPYKMWRNAMLPPLLLDNVVKYFNLRLDGKSHKTRKTSKRGGSCASSATWALWRHIRASRWPRCGPWCLAPRIFYRRQRWVAMGWASKDSN